MRFLVCSGIERDDGALFKTAETVPGVSPTCSATAFKVTTDDFLALGFLSFMRLLFGSPALDTSLRQCATGVEFYTKAKRATPAKLRGGRVLPRWRGRRRKPGR